MAEIFVSYTSEDKGWADWIGTELEKLGHKARLFDWEVSAGGNIAKWMIDRHDEADHVLCVVSPRYLDKTKRYSEWERLGAQLAAIGGRANFMIPVVVEPCELPTLLAPFKRCDLHGLDEQEAKMRLAGYLKPAAPPAGPVLFPGTRKVADHLTNLSPSTSVAFPGSISNVPINVPSHFFGRDHDLAAIEIALEDKNGRAAITALHGLRGVGKTVLAAAYAQLHRNRYRARWWIRAETESTMRADLAGLGIRLGWVSSDTPEEQSVAIVLEQLRTEGERILLIYDNAIGPKELAKYLPRGTEPHIIVTSNAPNWRGTASPVEIEVWPPEVGADFLIARIGRANERDSALALSTTLGGLPLAHEQAAAYCERLGISPDAYASRFEIAPGKFLDDALAAPEQYHNGLTVSKTFALAIEEAAKRHPAAKPLLIYAAFLAPEPIPLFLFSEGREGFSEPFASSIKDDGLDEAVATLRAFALADRETVADEHDPSVSTDCMRLHRLVRQVAAESEDDKLENVRRTLIAVLVAAYPKDAYRRPETWLQIRRLDALGTALVVSPRRPPEGTENSVANMLVALGAYRHFVLGSYSEARPLYERALSISEETFGHDDRKSLICTTFLAMLLKDQGDLDAARVLFERVLKMNEASSGPDHLDTAAALNNLGTVLETSGDLEGARLRYERALKIRESRLGAEHPQTALIMGNIGSVLYRQRDLLAAQPMLERSLAIREKAIGPYHPEISANLLNLSSLFFAKRDFAKALDFSKRALNMDEKIFPPEHPRLQSSAQATATVLEALRQTADAIALRKKFKLL